MELLTLRTAVTALIVVGGIVAGFGLGLAMRNPAAGLGAGFGLALVVVGLLSHFAAGSVS